MNCEEIFSSVETKGLFSEMVMDVGAALKRAEKEAPPPMEKGIRALRFMVQGYTCREIGVQMGASDKMVCA